MKPLLKICGLNQQLNILDVVSQQPDYIGFVFYSRSDRDAAGKISHEFAVSLPLEIKKVGVFVNDDANRIINYIGLYNLDFVQVHGNETPDFCRAIAKYAPVIKAFGVSSEFDFSTLTQYEDCCEYFLFDTKTELHGGSGKTFDHSVLENYNGKKQIFLSGGLDERNCQLVLRRKMPFVHALDLNSRLEISPGIKNISKIKAIKKLLNEHEILS